MHVAADGNYNLKVLNDAFAGRGHENEEFDLIKDDRGNTQVKKRTKRPPKAEKKEEPEKHIDNADSRMLAVVDEVMRRSAKDFNFGGAIGNDSDDEEEKSETNSQALVAFDEVG